MLIGLMTATKLTMSGLKAIASRKTFKSPNKKEMQVKYGLNVWALVVDAARNEDYCVYLAKQGINLILMGEQDDVKIARDMASFEDNDIKISEYIVDWSRKGFNYEAFKEEIKDLDIAFMILPKMEEPD